MEPIKVLLADDHSLFRSGIAEMLRREPDFEVVGEASNGEEDEVRKPRVPLGRDGDPDDADHTGNRD